MSPEREDGLFSVSEVAQIYHVSDETVRRWIRKGVISYVMSGPYRVKRIPKAEVEKHYIVVPKAGTDAA